MFTFRMHAQGAGRSRDLGTLYVKLWNSIIDESDVKHTIIAYFTSVQWFSAGFMWWLLCINKSYLGPLGLHRPYPNPNYRLCF